MAHVTAKLPSHTQQLHHKLPFSGNPVSAEAITVGCTSFASSHKQRP
jgi:hypothetical protein